MSAMDEIRARLTAAVEEPENNRAQLTYMVRSTKDMAKLLAAMDGVLALADQWTARGESDIAFSKTIPDENISVVLLTDGATMVENARNIRNAVSAALGVS